MSTTAADTTRYADIGDRSKPGIVVRFEPGFGLNVYIERIDGGGPYTKAEMVESFGMSIIGWEKICAAVDEWRRRNQVWQ